ncbi:MAG: histidine phosphatase family protein, partial [Chitinophagaceae bacterium]
MKYILTILLFSILATSCESTNNIYLVRHAEKSTEPANDPHLTIEGKQRAETLKDLLKDKKIKAIFSTETNRTIQTTTPLGRLINIPIQHYGNDSLPGFLQSVISSKKNVLIVGHSNTLIPMIGSLNLPYAIKNI